MRVRRVAIDELKPRLIRENTGVYYVGFWSQDLKDDEFIHPSKIVGQDWSPQLKQRIIDYLKGGTKCVNYMGPSFCRICGCRNGFSDCTDGKWVWPEGLSHYIAEHNVRLPLQFVEYMQENNFEIDSVAEYGGEPSFCFWNEWCAEQKR